MTTYNCWTSRTYCEPLKTPWRGPKSQRTLQCENLYFLSNREKKNKKTKNRTFFTFAIIHGLVRSRWKEVGFKIETNEVKSKRETMKIVTYNVNGLRQRIAQFGSLRNLLNSFDADIICLQVLYSQCLRSTEPRIFFPPL